MSTRGKSFFPLPTVRWRKFKRVWSYDHAGVYENDGQVVQGYNRDDCLSTWRLRDWLEGLRSDLIERMFPPTWRSAMLSSKDGGSLPIFSIGTGERKRRFGEFFRLSGLTAEELLDERAGLAGPLLGARPGTSSSVADATSTEPLIMPSCGEQRAAGPIAGLAYSESGVRDYRTAWSIRLVVSSVCT